MKTKWIVSLLFALLCAGCSTTERLQLRPVESPIPKAKPGVYDVSQVDVQPIPTRQSRPRYPVELRKNRIAGESVVIFTIKSDGTVTDASVVRAADVALGESAVEAVLKWRFRPAQIKGQPVDCRLMLPLVFSLNDD